MGLTTEEHFLIVSSQQTQQHFWQVSLPAPAVSSGTMFSCGALCPDVKQRHSPIPIIPGANRDPHQYTYLVQAFYLIPFCSPQIVLDGPLDLQHGYPFIKVLPPRKLTTKPGLRPYELHLLISGADWNQIQDLWLWNLWFILLDPRTLFPCLDKICTCSFFAAWLCQLKQITIPWEEAPWFTIKNYILIRISGRNRLHAQGIIEGSSIKGCVSELERRWGHYCA